MARARRQREQGVEHAGAPAHGSRFGRVLIAAPSERERQNLARALSLDEHTWIGAGTGVEASAFAEGCDLALIAESLDDRRGLVLVRKLAQQHAPLAMIVVSNNPSLDGAVEAMRSGAADLVWIDLPPEELSLRCEEALRRSTNARARTSELTKLRSTCQRLSDSQREMAHHVQSVCDELNNACKELAVQARVNGVTGEFSGIIRQELDVESVLRTGLEFILSKTGPTNAGVFLPSSTRDFSLGAYVNYDCPKDAADILLDQLASTFAPRMEEKREPIHLTSDDQLEAVLGDDASWIVGSNVLAISCRHQDECLAVIVLFRDRYSPFPEPVLEVIQPLASLFAQQLARVIHVHNRHLPKEKWSGLGEPGEDDIDLAA